MSKEFKIIYTGDPHTTKVIFDDKPIGWIQKIESVVSVDGISNCEITFVAKTPHPFNNTIVTPSPNFTDADGNLRVLPQDIVDAAAALQGIPGVKIKFNELYWNK